MNILKNSLIISLITFCSRITGYLRDILFAYFFGATAVFDLLIYSMKLPLYFKQIFFDTAFNNAFIPKIFSIKNN